MQLLPKMPEDNSDSACLLLTIIGKLSCADSKTWKLDDVHLAMKSIYICKGYWLVEGSPVQPCYLTQTSVTTICLGSNARSE